MRISNDKEDEKKHSAFERIIELQGDFQARLVEETMRYLQKLRGPLSPTAPGTVVRAGKEGELRVEGTIGGQVRIALELQNRQRVHTLVVPQVSGLVGEDGTTWFPEATSGAATNLLAPQQGAEVELSLSIPAELPPGVYRGALILLGFRNSGVPLSVLVRSSDKVTTPAAKKAAPAASRRQKAAAAAPATPGKKKTRSVRTKTKS